MGIRSELQLYLWCHQEIQPAACWWHHRLQTAWSVGSLGRNTRSNVGFSDQTHWFSFREDDRSSSSSPTPCSSSCPPPPIPFFLFWFRSNPYLDPIFQNSLFQSLSLGSSITCMHESGTCMHKPALQYVCQLTSQNVWARACSHAYIHFFFNFPLLWRQCSPRKRSAMKGKYVSCPCWPSKEREIYFCPHKWRCSNSLR